MRGGHNKGTDQSMKSGSKYPTRETVPLRREKYCTEGCSAAVHLAGEDALIFSTTRHQNILETAFKRKDIKLVRLSL
jgi:hypothetical protein